MNFQFIVPTDENSHGKALWGPRIWYLLHKISYNYPEKANKYVQKYYMNYFKILRYLIPCPYCGNHFKEAMNNKLLHRNLETRQQVIDWFRTLHNDINLLNGSRIYQGFEVDQLYEKTPFEHAKLIELIYYLIKVVLTIDIDRRILLHWLIMTYEIHPCNKCRCIAKDYFARFNIRKYNIMDNKVMVEWIERLLTATDHKL